MERKVYRRAVCTGWRTVAYARETALTASRSATPPRVMTCAACKGWRPRPEIELGFGS